MATRETSTTGPFSKIVGEYFFLSLPNSGKFLGEFHMNKSGYHRIKLVDDEHDALFFANEEQRDQLAVMLIGMGYEVAPGFLEASIQ